MIDLITPDELMINQKAATQPVINEYRHETQRPLDMQGALDAVQLAQTAWCMSTSTFNGTQTFAWNVTPDSVSAYVKEAEKLRGKVSPQEWEKVKDIVGEAVGAYK